MSLDQYEDAKNASARKSLIQFSDVFDIKQETEFYRFGAAKSSRKAIIAGNKLWSITSNRCGNTRNK